MKELARNATLSEDLVSLGPEPGMPIEMKTFQLPGGTRCVRVACSGHFSKEDADAYVKETGLGGPLSGLSRKRGSWGRR